MNCMASKYHFPPLMDGTAAFILLIYLWETTTFLYMKANISAGSNDRLLIFEFLFQWCCSVETI
ncbi:hypothetical protein BDR03DRAFT_938363 [Suillus americanus]|nr:hypothetical protein BDR03DRAFT_938363 [Suillus americanus]